MYDLVSRLNLLTVFLKDFRTKTSKLPINKVIIQKLYKNPPLSFRYCTCTMIGEISHISPDYPSGMNKISECEAIHTPLNSAFYHKFRSHCKNL